LRFSSERAPHDTHCRLFVFGQLLLRYVIISLRTWDFRERERERERRGGTAKHLLASRRDSWELSTATERYRRRRLKWFPRQLSVRGTVHSYCSSC